MAAREQRLVIRPATIALIAVAVVLCVIAAVYVVLTADALPSFFPGHEAGLTTHHIKHAVAFVGLAVLALVAAWFTSAPDRSEPTQ